MTEAVRWGILGTGKIARAFATALRDTPGAVLAGVASRSLEGAQAFGAEFGALACYGSYQALADADDIDVVYIGTPHPMHVENAVMALHGGKGVLCEKPFTMNRREAEEIVALAREKKLFLMEAMWTRFMPALAEVRRIIASGEIGTVHQVTADFGFAGTQDPLHRLNNPELGGGGLLDLGIYPLSIAAALLGPVADVQAMALMGETGVDIQTGFTMKHEGGGMSVCSCSLRARTPAELTVSGSLGQVRMDTMFHRAQSVTVTTLDGARTIATPYLGNGYVHEAMEVGRCLKEGLLESPGMPLDETLHLMGVLDTIRGQIGLRYSADR
ncbi:Gfo/Idh/MocA family protein [Massilia pseudoviolaceinigra]|uniref:Gfo/Idh/MocA family protein n=1 Tax=Massilia pseudoviolaceinigra TaxID=3057165 RepID=UPI002796B1CC|nr:Gfo/Idh/MocA family oxidoreductase [Massilia sp. CCM 9206]MDQ1922765.1 Gfo/Idh/MocA family oxidoreductase [Massilia sp. CCM 9206]